MYEGSTRLQAILGFAARHSLPDYKLRYILDQIYSKKISDFLSLKSLSKILRDDLSYMLGGQVLSIQADAPVLKHQKVQKITFKGLRGAQFDAVLVQGSKHSAAHISTQVGCAFSCAFCATGQIGFKRQLSVDEILDQVLYFEQAGVKLDSISFNGMGEPLANPDFFKALSILSDPSLFRHSPRRMNVSTIGVLPGLRKLNLQHPQLNVSFSLNSSLLKQRSSLMPAERMYSTDEVLRLLDERAVATRRRIWINYILIEDFTDTEEHAERLIRMMKVRPEAVRHLYHINLVPYNTVEAPHISKYRRSGSETIKRFAAALSKEHISCSVRKEAAEAIAGGSGQLFGGPMKDERA